MTNTKKKKKRALPFIIEEYSRDDRGKVNITIRYGIYLVAVMNFFSIIIYGIAGYKIMGAYGSVSDFLGLGLSPLGLIAEVIHSAIFTTLAVVIYRERLKQKAMKSGTTAK